MPTPLTDAAMVEIPTCDDTRLECFVPVKFCQGLELKLQRISKLAEQWRKDATQYKKQVDEARAKKLPHDQMLTASITLNSCAKDIENV